MLALLVFNALLVAQDEASFRASISLVHIDAEVLDTRGRTVADLKKGDFRIFDENKEQPIVVFSASEQPLDLILLIDISRSMRPKVKEIAAASQAALKELRSGDRLSIMTFNTKARIVLPLTADRGRVEQTLNDVLNQPFGGGTAIRSAVSEAANQFVRFGERRDQHRRAVLAVTDDVGIPNRREASVLEDLLEADALLSGLIVNNRLASISPVGLLSPLGVKRPGGIEGCVEKTGGDLIYSDDLTASFPEMIRRLRARYSLYYRLPDTKAGRARTVRTELSSEAVGRFPGAHVRARTRYTAQEVN